MDTADWLLWTSIIFEKTMRKMDEATTIQDGLKDVKFGNTVEGDASISNIRNKYGI